jgi:hypothetical protein
MARYKAAAKLFITDPATKVGRLVRAGEYFNSDDPPGKHWIGEDDEGVERVKSTPTPVLSSREAALKAEAEKRNERRQSAREENDKRAQAKLKGRDNGNRTPNASRAKDRPPTPGKTVAEQQTLGEEPTRD